MAELGALGDLFSLGYIARHSDDLSQFSLLMCRCVIAELWLEGHPLFTYGDLIAYKKGVYDPSSQVSKIAHPTVRTLVSRLIDKRPLMRRHPSDMEWYQSRSLVDS